jgi:hypothetical protein
MTGYHAAALNNLGLPQEGLRLALRGAAIADSLGESLTRVSAHYFVGQSQYGSGCRLSFAPRRCLQSRWPERCCTSNHRSSTNYCPKRGLSSPRRLGAAHPSNILARENERNLAGAEQTQQAALSLANYLEMRPLTAHCHLALGQLFANMKRASIYRSPWRCTVIWVCITGQTKRKRPCARCSPLNRNYLPRTRKHTKETKPDAKQRYVSSQFSTGKPSTRENSRTLPVTRTNPSVNA